MKLKSKTKLKNNNNDIHDKNNINGNENNHLLNLCLFFIVIEFYFHATPPIFSSSLHPFGWCWGEKKRRQQYHQKVQTYIFKCQQIYICLKYQDENKRIKFLLIEGTCQINPGYTREKKGQIIFVKGNKF